MKKLSSLSLFVALAGLALMPTSDSFAGMCLCSAKWDKSGVQLRKVVRGVSSQETCALDCKNESFAHSSFNADDQSRPGLEEILKKNEAKERKAVKEEKKVDLTYRESE